MGPGTDTSLPGTTTSLPGTDTSLPGTDTSLPGTTTSLRGMTNAGKATTLAKHNELRRRVAKGEEPGQPGAGDMRELVWDEELEAIAQRWADQCTFEHDEERSRTMLDGTGIGQNLYISYNSSETDQDGLDAAVESIVQDWYDEVGLFDGSNINSFAFSQATGHYTQLVWADTDKLGCANVYFNDTSHPSLPYYKNLVVCNYAIGGNVLGSAIYSQGTACSSCPSSTNCVDSLCQAA